MSKFNDLTGQKFNEWTALRFLGDYKWECQCSCGKIKAVDTYSLTHGISKSCGHNKYRDIEIGEYFGELEVIEHIRRTAYRCRCSCGNEIETTAGKLLNGQIKTCGHSKSRADLVGQKFNEWTVIKRDTSRPRHWICRCSCGNISSVLDYSLTHGKSKSCGHSEKPPATTQEIKVGAHIWNWDILRKVDYGVFECRCICGNVRNVNISSLRYGYSKSCGCQQGKYQRETLLNKYKEVATNRKDSKREMWQIEAISTKDNFEAYLVNLAVQLNRKPNTNDLTSRLDLQRPAILKNIHKYGLEDLIDFTEFVSNKEIEVRDYIKGIYNGEVICNSQKIINKQELDIYIPEYNLAIEFNGNYWHSDEIKDKMYHQNKSLNCAKQKIRLIHIFEYEWDDIDKQAKIKELLRGILCPQDNIKMYARESIVKEIENSEAIEFCNKYHINNGINSRVNLGLFNNNELVGVMTFGLKRYSEKEEKEWEIYRLAYKDKIIVTGGTQKMFKYFVDKYNPEIITTYADFAKFLGGIYFKLGFKAAKPPITLPNYVWKNTSNGNLLPRYRTTKKKLIEAGLGVETQTEDEIMKSLGYIKIYDCGNRKFIWENRDM